MMEAASTLLCKEGRAGLIQACPAWMTVWFVVIVFMKQANSDYGKTRTKAATAMARPIRNAYRPMSSAFC